MTERPILFSAPMVRALLAGTKTQTRRIVKLRGAEVIEERQRNDPDDNVLSTESWPCPYGRPGDRLWVRETWASLQPTTDAATATAHRDRLVERPEDGEHVALWYRADGEMPLVEQLWADDDDGIRWRPSIHMPRWASRITLEVTGVRVERLHAISEADAKAEGVDAPYVDREEFDSSLCPICGGTGLFTDFNPVTYGARPDTDCTRCDTSAKRYRWLWESINGTDSWAANPWVWVIEVKRVEQ